MGARRRSRTIPGVLWPLGAFWGLCISSGAHALKAEYRPLAARADSLATLAMAAIREGREAAAVDHLARIQRDGGLAFISASFVIEIDRAVSRRYHAVFQAPIDADSLVGEGSEWPEGGPSAYGACWGNDTEWCFEPSQDHRDRCLVRKHNGTGRLEVDLGMDGTIDITCQGTEVRVDPSLVMAVDRAADGRRMQWLIARPGNEPRVRPSVWYYMDGPLFWLLADNEGDGRGECGVVGFLPVDP